MADALTWQKSSFSGGEDGDNCVEVATGAEDMLALRESDAPGVRLSATPVALASLIRRLKAATTPDSVR